jgi:hypothetical protein
MKVWGVHCNAQFVQHFGDHHGFLLGNDPLAGPRPVGVQKVGPRAFQSPDHVTLKRETLVETALPLQERRHATLKNVRRRVAPSGHEPQLPSSSGQHSSPAFRFSPKVRQTLDFRFPTDIHDSFGRFSEGREDGGVSAKTFPLSRWTLFSVFQNDGFIRVRDEVA